jgi:hypothetical protein
MARRRSQIDHYAEGVSGKRSPGRPPNEQRPLRRVERTLSGKKK